MVDETRWYMRNYKVTPYDYLPPSNTLCPLVYQPNWVRYRRVSHAIDRTPLLDKALWIYPVASHHSEVLENVTDLYISRGAYPSRSSHDTYDHPTYLTKITPVKHARLREDCSFTANLWFTKSCNMQDPCTPAYIHGFLILAFTICLFYFPCVHTCIPRDHVFIWT